MKVFCLVVFDLCDYTVTFEVKFIMLDPCFPIFAASVSLQFLEVLMTHFFQISCRKRVWFSELTPEDDILDLGCILSICLLFHQVLNHNVYLLLLLLRP